MKQHDVDGASLLKYCMGARQNCTPPLALCSDFYIFGFAFAFASALVTGWTPVSACAAPVLISSVDSHTTHFETKVEPSFDQ